MGDGQVGLESIDLSYNEITDSGAQKLMLRLLRRRASRQIKQLNVHKTSITEVSRRQLAGLKLLRKGLSVLVDDEDKELLAVVNTARSSLYVLVSPVAVLGLTLVGGIRCIVTVPTALVGENRSVLVSYKR